jgi:hypothetical protein
LRLDIRVSVHVINKLGQVHFCFSHLKALFKRGLRQLLELARVQSPGLIGMRSLSVVPLLRNHYCSTDQMSVSEIVVSLLHCPERIAIDKTLNSAEGRHLDNLHQCDAATVKTRYELRARRLFEEVEGNGTAARADTLVVFAHSVAGTPASLLLT